MVMDRSVRSLKPTAAGMKSLEHWNSFVGTSEIYLQEKTTYEHM